MAKKTIPQETSTSQSIAPSSYPSTGAAAEREMRVAEIEHVNGGLLNPLDGKNGLTATLFAPRGSSDTKFFWRLENYDQPVFEPLVPSDGSDEVEIPSDWVSRCIGQPVKYWYESRVNGAYQRSIVGDVFVQNLTEDQAVDALPRFPQEVVEFGTHWLKMKNFPGEDGILRFNAPPMAVEGMRLYLGVEGYPDAFMWLEFGRAISAEEARPGHEFEYSIARGWMARRVDRSSLTPKIAWVYSGNSGEFGTSDPVNHQDLPKNGEDLHSRVTTLLVVEPGLNLLAPHLRQSAQDEGKWFLNPDNIDNEGDVDARMTTFAGDTVNFHVSGLGAAKQPLGSVPITADGQLASVKLPACTVACFFNQQMTLSYDVATGSTPTPSPAKVINVLAPEFQRPLIEEANPDRVLCLDNFSGDAKVIAPLGKYSECASHCWMWIVGKREDGRDYRFDILVGATVTEVWKKDGIRADIPRAALERIGDCSKFELQVKTSFCEASELKDALEFPPATFTIYQKPLTLRAPTVREAQGGVLVAWNGREGAHVEVDYEGYQTSHRHTAQCCLDEADSCWSLPLQEGASGPVTFLMTREQVINSFGKTALITYTVINACKQMVSDTLELQVGEPLMQRRSRPMVRQATGNTLDLRTFPGKDAEVIIKSTDADVDLAWWFFMPGHFGIMTLEGTAEDDSSITIPIMARPLENGDRYALSCLIARSDLETLKNNTPFTINFSQFIGPKPVGSVEIKFQPLRLLLINPTSLPLPLPSVPEAESEELNFLQLCCGNAHLVVSPWDAITTDNRISLNCTGTAIGGISHSVVLLQERAVTPSEVLNGLKIVITSAQFASFANGSEITLQLNMRRLPNDGVRPFEPVKLKLIKSRQIIERFDGQPKQLLEAGESISLSTMTITMLQLAADAPGGIYTFGNAGEFMSGPAFGFCINAPGYTTPAQITRFAFTVPCACLRFAYAYLDGKATVRFYAESGALIETRILDSAKGGRNQWVEFRAGKGKLLASFEVEVGEQGYLDNFTMCSPVDA
ncbi:hypothetical protein C4K03_4410 [Pseudomonas synxantha]|uniref:Uncharacterized protein n=1 Tax=Pseudomonas synxantha TaxID=47883 RepID=A0A3G7UDA5_9PSED|nr:hypothetical protein [Pseudomonas synxantha]AZE56548.1 hypothetical protein C4K03_4410 [Pseudomonas synxantha]